MADAAAAALRIWLMLLLWGKRVWLLLLWRFKSAGQT